MKPFCERPAYSRNESSENSNGTTTLDFSTAALTNPGGKQPGWSHSGLWTTPVPEPETYALLLAGLAGVGFMARRRKSA